MYMPNHVINIIKVINATTTEQNNILLSLLNSEGLFDFNHYVKMPAILKNTTAPNTINAEFCKKKTGYTDWYDWRVKEWGTKWNAYEQNIIYERLAIQPWHLSHHNTNFLMNKTYRCYVTRINKKRYKAALRNAIDINYIKFQTAWNCPMEVYIAMSKKHPDVIFEISYADEDLGVNCGVFMIENGDVLINDIDEVLEYEIMVKEDEVLMKLIEDGIKYNKPTLFAHFLWEKYD